MNYAQINKQNKVVAFPRSLKQLVEAGVIFSVELSAEELASAGVVEVEPTSSPAPNDEYLKDLQAVRQQDGTWKQQWVRLETSDEYKAAATIRKTQQVLTERQAYLNYSDWTQFADVQLANKAEWATYRQQLRDVTQQTGYPWAVIWPTRPAK